MYIFGKDVWLIILRFVNADSIYAMSQTCRYFDQLCGNPILGRHYLGPIYDKLVRPSRWRRILYLRTAINHSKLYEIDTKVHNQIEPTLWNMYVTDIVCLSTEEKSFSREIKYSSQTFDIIMIIVNPANENHPTTTIYIDKKTQSVRSLAKNFIPRDSSPIAFYLAFKHPKCKNKCLKLKEMIYFSTLCQTWSEALDVNIKKFLFE